MLVQKGRSTFFKNLLLFYENSQKFTTLAIDKTTTMKQKLLLSAFICFIAIGLKAQCPPTPTPSICMVTCDGASVNNIIYWDKTGLTHVDSFIVFREVTAGVYKQIGAVPNDSLSQFTDTSRSIGPANGDPNIASYRYKIQIRDSCGFVGGLSPYHNTIYITDAGAGQFDWSVPYSIEGSGSPVISYVLLCDTLGTGTSWGPVATVSSSSSSAIDPTFASHSSIANWRVKTAWGISCTPTHASINTTRSNIKHPALALGILSATELNKTIAVYPNPANGMVTIELTALVQKMSIKIINVLGETIYEENINNTVAGKISKQLDLSAYAKGLYTVSIESAGAKVFKKLIVN